MRIKTPLLSLAVAVTAAWTLNGSAQARPLDDVMASGELSVMVYRDFPPWSARVDGKLVGVDVDIAQALAQLMGLKLRIEELTADDSVDDDLRNGVWKGSKVGGPIGDIMLHIPYDRVLETRNGRVALFAPYFRETMAVVRRTETPALGLLNGQRVGVEAASLADLYLSGAFGGQMRNSLHRYPLLSQAVADLHSGEMDALVGTKGDLEGGLGTVRTGWVISSPAFPGLPKQSWPLGIAVRDDSRDLGYAMEDAFAALSEDGRLATIFQAHGLTYTPPQQE